jgi:hypothetical protein
MTIPTTRTSVIIVGVALLTLACAGCSGGEKVVTKTDVANQISVKVNGIKPDSVTCPDNLKGQVGATLHCEFKNAGQTFGVNVTVTSVNGDDVEFSMVETVYKDDVANAVRDMVSQQHGRIDPVTCPTDLNATVGAAERCDITDRGVQYEIKVDDQPK